MASERAGGPDADTITGPAGRSAGGAAGGADHRCGASPWVTGAGADASGGGAADGSAGGAAGCDGFGPSGGDGSTGGADSTDGSASGAGGSPPSPSLSCSKPGGVHGSGSSG